MMPRHVALDLALQRMAGLSDEPGQGHELSEDPAQPAPKLGLRTRLSVASAALRGDMDKIRSLTTQRPASKVGS